MDENIRIQMVDISKHFAGIKALDNAQIQVRAGEIHALVGENGAGKSTLMKILSGALRRNSGEIYFEGQKVEINHPIEAHRLGIATIYQEFMLAPDLTVAENIFVEKLSQGVKIINWKELNQKAAKLLAELGFEEIDPSEKVGNLSIAYQQVVEICKSLSQQVKVLILDEPTAVLTFKEIEKLFILLRKLKNDGVSIIYISHRLEEIFQICDQVTVMKDGAFVKQVGTKDIDKDHLIRLMVGRDIQDIFPKRENVHIGQTVLEAKNICSGSQVQNISFSVREGEVLGFYGLVGAGRTETMRAIFGADAIESGDLYFMNEKVRFRSPKEAVSRGIGMVPEDRKRQGLILEQSIRENTTITAMQRVKNVLRLFDRKKETDFAKSILDSINTKYASVENKAQSLSGGNQQKIALAKWLAAGSKCVIFDEPTRGVDVGAKAEIYTCINQLAKQGIAIIMISSEMPELMGMSDRIIVMRQGKIAGELSKQELTENNLIVRAMGGDE